MTKAQIQFYAINAAETPGDHIYIYIWNTDPYLTSHTNFSSRWIINLNMKAKTVKKL